MSSTAPLLPHPARPRLLPDELVRQLVAAGQTDVLVGMVTLNHAETVAPVVKATLEAFAGPLLRQRTLLLDIDGGSSDGTPALVQGLSAASGGVAVPHPLRTVHRLASPYHGVPGRSAGLAVLLAAAELLGVKALVVLNPEFDGISSREIAALVEAVTKGPRDFVKVAPLRSPWEAPLLSQLVRPWLGSTFGRTLYELLDLQFACSGRFAASARRLLEGTASAPVHGSDLRLAAHALAEPYAVAQMTVARDPWVPRRAYGLAEVFVDVVGGTLEALVSIPATREGGSRPVEQLGPPRQLGARRPSIPLEGLRGSYVEGVRQLRPILEALLPGPLHRALEAATQERPARLGVSLWAQLTSQFLACARERRMLTSQLAQALMPLYQGRVATFLDEALALPPAAAEAESTRLMEAFAGAAANGDRS